MRRCDSVTSAWRRSRGSVLERNHQSCELLNALAVHLLKKPQTRQTLRNLDEKNKLGKMGGKKNLSAATSTSDPALFIPRPYTPQPRPQVATFLGLDASGFC